MAASRSPGLSDLSAPTALMSLFSVVLALPPHGWDCISCSTNTMLAGNWAINNPNFNNSDLWWAHTITSSYAAVALNMNHGDPSLTVEQARILKKINPKFKFLVSTSRMMTSVLSAA